VRSPRLGIFRYPRPTFLQIVLSNFFILNIEKLFHEGNIILRVEASGGTSKLISWRLCFRSDQGPKWQLEGAYEQSYAI
jgi:hypothetical protein